jgi:transposase
MARLRPWEISDELWQVIEPLLPKRERRFRHHLDPAMSVTP